MVGQGSFVDVWLQKQAGSATQRAVKVLRRMSLQFQSIEYKRELEALAKFDKLQAGDHSVVLFLHFLLFYLSNNNDAIFLSGPFAPVKVKFIKGFLLFDTPVCCIIATNYLGDIRFDRRKSL